MLFRTYGQRFSSSGTPAPLAGTRPHRQGHGYRPLRQTVTFDNGTESAITNSIPWAYRPSSAAKGGIENAIGRLRRTLPRKTVAELPHRFTLLIQAYNNRKCGYYTPSETI